MAIDFRNIFGKKSASPSFEPGPAPTEEPVLTEPDEAINLLIWGPTGSGKTSFVGGWYYTDPRPWKIKEDDEQTRDYAQAIMDSLSRGEFMMPNDIARITDLNFTFERRRPFFSTERLKIHVPECAGGRFATMDAELLNRIDEYDGVLWLIDPILAWNEQQMSKSDLKERKKENPPYVTYREMLHKWLHAFYVARSARLRGNRRMAFCLTKMDHPYHVTWKDRPEPHFREMLDWETIRIIDDHCDKGDYKVFACSLAGLDEQGASNAMQQSYSGANKLESTIGVRLNSRPKPFGMFQPLEWLLGKE